MYIASSTMTVCINIVIYKVNSFYILLIKTKSLVDDVSIVDKTKKEFS